MDETSAQNTGDDPVFNLTAIITEYQKPASLPKEYQTVFKYAEDLVDDQSFFSLDSFLRVIPKKLLEKKVGPTSCEDIEDALREIAGILEKGKNRDSLGCQFDCFLTLIPKKSEELLEKAVRSESCETIFKILIQIGKDLANEGLVCRDDCQYKNNGCLTDCILFLKRLSHKVSHYDAD